MIIATKFYEDNLKTEEQIEILGNDNLKNDVGTWIKPYIKPSIGLKKVNWDTAMRREASLEISFSQKQNNTAKGTIKYTQSFFKRTYYKNKEL